MKNIFLLTLLVVLFTACGDDDNSGDGNKKPTPPPGVDTQWLGDWNDRNDPAFKPEYNEEYCPMWDQWQVTKKNGQPYTDVLIYEIDSDRWYTSTAINADKTPKWESPSMRILINNKQIKDKATDRIFEYQLRVNETEDKLIIFDGRDTFECEVYEYSRFRKIADWNSPSNRHYEFYKGKYNPIKGKWKIVKENNKPVSPLGVYYYDFSEDLRMIYIDSGGTSRPPRSYSINDKYVDISEWGIRAYQVTKDTLYMDLYDGVYYRILVKEK